MQTLSTWRTPPHDRAIGIEVECFMEKHFYYEKERENNESKYFGFFFAGSDGSINIPPNSFLDKEFVSQPLTPKWLKKELTKLYKTFPTIQWNSSCGIHLHISKGWFTNKKAEAVQKWISSLSEDEFEELFGRKPNNYCSQTCSKNSRYRAVNITNSKTNEFRMFASGSEKWAHFCVDMAEYLVKNAYYLNFEAVLAFKELSYKENV